MLNVDKAYKDLYNSSGGKKLRLIFYKDDYNVLYPSETLFPSEQLYPAEMSEDSVDFEITDDQIQTDTLTITSSITTNEDLDFGACECSQMELTVSGLSENISGKEFLLTQQFGSHEMVLGLFTVDSTPKQEDKDTRKIIAYDRMKRFDNDVSGWYNLLEFPLTLKEFRDSICEFIGITQVDSTLINDDLIIDKTLDTTTLNGRDVMRYICQINGAFGNINSNGQFRYIEITKSEDVLDQISIYQSAESEEYTVPDIDTVQIRQEEGDIGGVSTGDGENVYIIEGNPLVYGKTTSELIEIANNIKSVISGLSYQPASISTNGAPWREVGDRVSLETSDGTINTIIMSRTLTGTQGMMDSYNSSGSQELTQAFNIETEIIQIKGLSAVLKRTVEEVSNELTNLENETTSKFAQTAEQITAEVTRATAAEGQLSSRITQTAEQISLKVSKGDVTSQLNSELTITGNSIALTTGHFTINAKNMTVDSAGNADFSGSITGATFNGGSINIGSGNFTVNSAGSVEAKDAKITASTLSATGIVYAHNGVVCDGTMNADKIEAISGAIDDLMSGEIYCSGTVYGSDWQYISDKRKKRDIEDLPPETCLNIIKRLRPVAYTLIDNGVRGTGFIAQEVNDISNSMGLDYSIVSYSEKHKMYTISYKNYIAILVGAIQKIQERLGI